MKEAYRHRYSCKRVTFQEYINSYTKVWNANSIEDREELESEEIARELAKQGWLPGTDQVCLVDAFMRRGFKSVIGTQWQADVARQAQDVNLFKGITKTDQTTAISREEAFQCTFNALTQVQMVKYDGTAQQYIQLIPATAADSYKGTLGWQNFKIEAVTTAAVDHYWARWPGTDLPLTNTYSGVGSVALSQGQNYGETSGGISDIPSTR